MLGASTPAADFTSEPTDSSPLVAQLPGIDGAINDDLYQTATDPLEIRGPDWIPAGIVDEATYLPVASVSQTADDDGGRACTEQELDKIRQAIAGSHKLVFYKNDFSYLNDPCYPCLDDCGLGDCLKRNELGERIIWDVGGSYRMRFHGEQNMRGLGLTGRDDRFLLHQTRVYVNAQVDDVFRFYAEYIDAESNYENFAPRAIEVNRSDLLNIFGDVNLLDDGYTAVTARGGRQELIYGAQRLVSPLGWGNTRRTFDGVSLLGKVGDWSVDGFWTRPVVVDRHNFDNPDESQAFMGVYASRPDGPLKAREWYYLRYTENDGTTFEFDTLGGRWLDSYGNWLAEVEGAVQLGEFAGEDHTAGFFVLGGGYKWADLPWTPVFWAYYDWASGDDTIGNGFHHLFPLSHRYVGFMDLFGRRNLENPNFQLTLTPSNRLELLLWYHIFYLQNGNDVPYNVNMTPFTTTRGGNQYLGQEIDLLATWKFTPRTSLLLGYSHFFAGRYYETNPSVPFANDADFYYTELTVNF